MAYETAYERDAREAKEAKAAEKARAERVAAKAAATANDAWNVGKAPDGTTRTEAAEEKAADKAAAKATADEEKAAGKAEHAADKDEKEAAKKIAADAKAELTREKADVRYARRVEEKTAKLASKQKAVDAAGAALSKAQGELTAAGVEFDTKFDADNEPTQADIDYAAGVKAQRDAANLRAGITETLR